MEGQELLTGQVEAVVGPQLSVGDVDEDLFLEIEQLEDGQRVTLAVDGAQVVAGVGELGSRRQQEIVAALMTCPTKTAAAKALCISRGALYRHLAEPELKEAYEQLRAAAIADATDSLQTVAEQAVSVLHEIANDPGVVPNVRVSAASKILDTAIKAHELQDVLSRLEALEMEMA